MFCSNCGKELLGNFCANCGSPANVEPVETIELSIEERSIIARNGKFVNLYEQYLVMGKNRLGLTCAVSNAFRIPHKEARVIVDAFLEMIADLPQLTLLQRSANQLKQGARKSINTRHAEMDRVAEMDEQGTLYCPKCHSTSLSANKKGFGIGKAVVGAVAAGPLGLVVGNAGAKKVRVTCLKCGHQWIAGK